MAGGEKQADGCCQGHPLALPSQLSGLKLREGLGLKGVTDGQDERGREHLREGEEDRSSGLLPLLSLPELTKPGWRLEQVTMPTPAFCCSHCCSCGGLQAPISDGFLVILLHFCLNLIRRCLDGK